MFVDPGHKNNYTNRSYIILGTQAGSILVQVTTLVKRDGEIPVTESVTLFYQIVEGVAIVPIKGGTAPIVNLSIKPDLKASTYSVQVVFPAPSNK